MPPVRYRADPPELRPIVQLDGLTLIFHIPSGTTHVVTSPVPELLDLLSAQPDSADGLLARLESEHEVQADGGATEAITARLEELAAAGLVHAG